MALLTVKQLSDKYFMSSDYNGLSDKSKVDYKNFMNILLGTEVDECIIQEAVATAS